MLRNAFIKLLAAGIRKQRLLVKLTKRLAREVSPETVVILDFPIDPRPRWSEDKPHSELYNIIDSNKNTYKRLLESFKLFSEVFLTIPVYQHDENAVEPNWVNGLMPALDGVALYSFIAMFRPKYFIEVGSGNSTKFARKAIHDHGLNTKIVSVDPHPRARIDNICDEVIRKPVEKVDLELFDRLDVNDILYVDNSHRVFMNSDATTVFLDVIPRLHSGVLVEIHDVTLPYDYPEHWTDRFYSEQYLLAAYLLAKGQQFEILLANTFISRDSDLASILLPLWEREEMQGVDRRGCSFWMKIN